MLNQPILRTLNHQLMVHYCCFLTTLSKVFRFGGLILQKVGSWSSQ